VRLDDAPPAATGVQSVLDPVDLARQIAPLNSRISVLIRNRKRTREVAEMPYSKTAELPDPVKALPKAKRNKWMAVFNSAHKGYAGDKDAEQKAFATAWAAVKGTVGNKKKDKAACEFSACERTLCDPMTCDHKKMMAEAGTKVAAERDFMGHVLHNYELTSGARRLMLFPRGEFSHPDYGTMTFDDEFFNDIMKNFDGKVLGETKPFIDVDHNHGAACAWVQGLSIEPDGMYGTVDWTSLGEELIASGQYKYFSPWWGAYKDPSTGTTFERVLRGGALTNIPFLKVLPPVELYEPGKPSAARDRAFHSGVEFKLAEMTPLSLPAGTSIDQLGTRIRGAFNDQFAPRYSQLPTSSPWWLVDIFDDHVIAAFGEGGGPSIYYSIPYAIEDEDYAFDLDKKQEVQQAWEPVPVAEQRNHGLTDVLDLRTRYGAVRAVAHVLRESRQQRMLAVLSERNHGAFHHAATN